MRTTISLTLAALCMSAAMTGCFVSRKETVREVPVAPTTVESSRTTVETAPPASEVRTHTTVEKY